MNKKVQQHPFSYGDAKSLAFICFTCFALLLTVGAVMYLHSLFFGWLVFDFWNNISFRNSWLVVACDVVREATYEGMHTFACSAWFTNWRCAFYSF